MQVKPKVLMVEDDTNLRLTLSEILHQAGYVVVSITGAENVLRQMALHAFDLVFIDLDLMRADQACLLEMIYCMLPTVPVLIITASPILLPPGIRATAASPAFLLKPISPTHILTRIGELLLNPER